MRKNLLNHLLLVTLFLIPTWTGSAQSFSSFILSGKAGDLATGDLSFKTPELAVNKVDLSLSYGKWMPQYLNYSALQAGGFIPLNERLGIRIDYRNNLYPEIQKVDVNGNENGTFKLGQQRIMAGISVRVLDNLFLDVNGKYLMANLADSKASAIVGDVAVNYINGDLTIGVKGSDLGSKYKISQTSWSLPMRIQAGGTYRITLQEQHTVMVGADLGYILPQEYNAFTATAGAEYAFNEMIFVRSGYHYSSAVAPSFASFGLGFTYKGIGIDAAYLVGNVSNAWTATLRFSM